MKSLRVLSLLVSSFLITTSIAAQISVLVPAGAATTGAPTDAVAGTDDDVVAPLDPAIRADLEAALSADVMERERFDRIVHATDIAHGGLEPLVQVLEESRSRSNGDVRILESLARVLLMIGRLNDAKTVLREATSGAASSDPAMVRLLAEVEDATDDQAASATFERLAGLEAEPTRRRHAERRRALRLISAAKASEMPAIAARAVDGATPAERALFATSIALAGHGDVALGLTDPAAGEQYVFALRRAEWSLRSGDLASAEASALDAVGLATSARDRRYALSVAFDVHSRSGHLDALAAHLEALPQKTPESLKTWIDVLRELERSEVARRLLAEERQGAGRGFDGAMQRELAGIAIASSDDASSIALFRELIGSGRDEVRWKEELSRFLLSRGEAKAAEDVWDVPPERKLSASELLEIAASEAAVGFEDLALRSADAASELPGGRVAATMFRVQRLMNAGRMADAEKELEELETSIGEDTSVMAEIAEAWERLGRAADAVRILEKLRSKLSAEDLDLRLAWLLSEVDREDDALALWTDLWRRVASVARRNYVEDRLLNVASRLGKLGDLAVDLELRLDRGEADDLERRLLVKLYSKANDPVSAAEVLDEFGRRSGKTLEALIESARVYQECADYQNYEAAVRRIIDLDADNAVDWLRQLAMSALERARPEEARAILSELEKSPPSADSEEFEAGVLSLAGLKKEAIRAYRRSLARHPDHIEVYLLLGAEMSALGKKTEAIGIFQFLAITADRDDLYGVAIDGLLNLGAGRPVLEWARRSTLDRLAGGGDKMTLYHLYSDLSAEAGDNEASRRAIEESLPIGGERRTSLLRELIDLVGEKGEERLHYGRRVLTLGEEVPPDVFLSLGQYFLDKGDARVAKRTFLRAQDVPDHAAYLKQVAQKFAEADLKKEALELYLEALMLARNDVALITTIAEIEEELGSREAALAHYLNAMTLMLARRPLDSGKVREKSEDDDFGMWFGGANVDAFDTHYARVLAGVLSNRNPADVETCFALEAARLAADVDQVERRTDRTPVEDLIGKHPRIDDRAAYLRRSALSAARHDLADQIDRRLLGAFPGDADLLMECVKARIEWGYPQAAVALVDASTLSGDALRKVASLVGRADRGATFMKPPEAAAGILQVILEGDRAAMLDFLSRVDFGPLEEIESRALPTLMNAAGAIGEKGLVLSFARRAIDIGIRFKKGYPMREAVDGVVAGASPYLADGEVEILARHVADAYLAEPESRSELITVIARLQRRLGRELFDISKIIDRLEAGAKTQYWSLAEPLAVIPKEKLLALLPKLIEAIPAAGRFDFFLRMAGRIDAPLDPGEVAVLQEIFKTTVQSAREKVYLHQFKAPVLENRRQPALAAALAEVAAARWPDDPAVLVAAASAFARVGRSDEANDLAMRSAKGVIALQKFDWWANETVGVLLDLVDVGRRQEIERLAREALAERPNALPTCFLLSRIARLEDRVAEAVELMRDGAKIAPDDIAFAGEYRVLLSAAGRKYDEALALQALHDSKRENVFYANELKRRWLELRHPLNAAKVVVKKSPWGSFDTPELVRDALASGDSDKARRRTRVGLRQLGDEYYSPFRDDFVGRWTEPDTGDDVLPRLEEKPQRSLFDVLAELEFGAGEMEAVIRTMTPTQFGDAPLLRRGYTRAVVSGSDAKSAAERLERRLRSGQGTRIDRLVYLEILASHPDLIDDGNTPFLDQMVSDVDARETALIRIFAKVKARIGKTEEARRLFDWVIQQSLGGPGDFNSDFNVARLVDDAEAIFGVDGSKELLRRIVAIAPSPEYEFLRDRADAQILELAGRIAPPEEALALRPDIIARIAETSELEFGQGQTPSVAAGLAAAAGRFEDACRWFDAARKSARSSRDYVDGASWFRILNAVVRRDLAPEKKTLWNTELGRHVAELEANGAMSRREAAMVELFMALRARSDGDLESVARHAGAAVQRIAGWGKDELWCAALLREAGRNDQALAIETRLLSNGSLAVSRIARTLRDIAATDRRRAYDLGLGAAKYTLDPEVLKLVIEWGREFGESEVAESWRKVGLEAWPDDLDFQTP